MLGPTTTAREVEARCGLWNEEDGKKTWRGATWNPDFDAQTDFFVHGTEVDIAMSAIIDGFLKPTVMGSKCEQHNCGTPGVHLLSMPFLSDVEMAESFAELTSLGYCHGAMIITKLMGVPVPGKQNLEILPGMIATREHKGEIRHFVAHCDCIEYHSVVFDEERLIQGLMGALYHVSSGNYNVEVHRCLREIQEWVESKSRSETKPEERMVLLQNSVEPTPSKDAGQRKNQHEAALRAYWSQKQEQQRQGAPMEQNPQTWVPYGWQEQQGQPDFTISQAASQPQLCWQVCEEYWRHCQPAPQVAPPPPPLEPPPATVEQPVTTSGRRTTEVDKGAPVTKEEATTAADMGAPVTLTVQPKQKKHDDASSSTSDTSPSLVDSSDATRKCPVHANGAKVDADSQGSSDCVDSPHSSNADALVLQVHGRGSPRASNTAARVRTSESAHERLATVPPEGHPQSKNRAKTQSPSPSSAPRDSARNTLRARKVMSQGEQNDTWGIMPPRPRC